MSLRTALTWLRFFWPVVPGIAAALGAGWLLWGLGFVWSVVVPVVAGLGVFVLFTWVQIAAGVGGAR